jgi:hypothetical protein
MVQDPMTFRGGGALSLQEWTRSSDEEKRVTPFLHVIYMYDQESPVGRLCRRCQTVHGQKNAASSSIGHQAEPMSYI